MELERDLAQPARSGCGHRLLGHRSARAHEQRLVADHQHGILAAEAVVLGLSRIAVGHPLVAVDHELVGDASGRQFDDGVPAAVLVAVGQRVRGGVPAIEAAGDRDAADAADHGLVAERHGSRPRRCGEQQRGQRHQEQQGPCSSQGGSHRVLQVLEGGAAEKPMRARQRPHPHGETHLMVTMEFLPPKPSSFASGFDSSCFHVLPLMRNL